ncbi:MAG: gamma-butyrobetaine hydroxylase-like domain-containing protein [Chloroflexi bacterium]|nr:gamma-butyrobetaine hydroxylase-like domain-containing protein [Chloroflexota bacterium]
MKPTSITANCGKKELAVLWDNGHASLYTFSLLRAGCPCAECRGGQFSGSRIAA